MQIGQKISKARIEARTSVRVLAAEVGASEAGIRQIEAGDIRQPKVGLCLKIARALGQNLEWLADDDMDWPPPVDDRQRVAAIIEGALTGAGLTGELSAEEIRLVGEFRRLSDVEKVRLGGFLAGLTSREPLSPEGAAAAIQSAADQVHQARRQDPRRSRGSVERSDKGSQTAS